jgi:hypothetical protein
MIQRRPKHLKEYYMQIPFLITYHWDMRPHPRSFSPDDYLDASPVFIALRHFLAQYHGDFSFITYDQSIRFGLDPDLSTVFEELPEVLTQLCEDTADEVELAFFEQGTDLTLWLQRCGDAIYMRFAVGDHARAAFTHLPTTPLRVSAAMFLQAWHDFLVTVFTMLALLEPPLLHAPSYRMYRAHLDMIIA